MKIQIKVMPHSKENSVERIGNTNYYKVKVTAAPEKGRANEKVKEILAEYFKVKKYRIEIVKGLTIPDKLVNIRD